MKLATAVSEVIHYKSALAGDAAQRIDLAKRAIRKGRYAAQDFTDSVALAVRREPLKYLGMTIAAACSIGVLAGWMAATRSPRHV